jgi:hypothetical protein
MRQDDASGATRAHDTSGAYDDRALHRLRHKDVKGLVGLMDDYQSLADELEEIGTRKSDPGGPPTRRRAA